MINEINEMINRLRAQAEGIDLVIDVERPRDDRNEFFVHCREASQKFYSVHYTLVEEWGEDIVVKKMEGFEALVNRIINAKK